MVSRNALIILTAIFVISLAAPIADTLTSPRQEAPDEEAPVAAPPVVFTQLARYSASIEAEIVSIEPTIFATGISDTGNTAKLRESILAISGVSNATVTREDNPGSDGLYLYRFQVTASDISRLEEAEYFFKKAVSETVSLAPAAAQAVILLPESVEATSEQGASTTISLAQIGRARAWAYPRSKPGETKLFSLEIVQSKGAVAQVSALEQASFYLPPTEMHTAEVEGTVESIVAKIVAMVVSEEPDLGSLEAGFLAANGFSATASFIPVENGTGGTLELRSEPEHPLFGAVLPFEVSDTLYLADIRLPGTAEANGSTYDISSRALLTGRRTHAGAGESVKVTLDIQTLFGDFQALFATIEN